MSNKEINPNWIPTSKQEVKHIYLTSDPLPTLFHVNPSIVEPIMNQAFIDSILHSTVSTDNLSIIYRAWKTLLDIRLSNWKAQLTEGEQDTSHPTHYLIYNEEELIKKLNKLYIVT